MANEAARGPRPRLRSLRLDEPVGLATTNLGSVYALGRASQMNRRLRVGRGLLVVWAVASGLLAFFPDDPVGTPTRGSGSVHLAFASVAFLAMLVGGILASAPLRAQPRRQPFGLPMTVVSWVALLPALLLGRAGLHLHSLGGLYEKVFLGMELLWLGLAAAPIALEQLPLHRPLAGPGLDRT